MKYSLKRIVCLVLSIVIVLSVNISFAEENYTNERESFEAMCDEFFEEAMAAYNVPGITLAVVKDGKLYYKKGYGYSDLENKIPVNPDTTLFRIGSVTKLFTATAAMQLYERGLLDVNDEVNKYLPGNEIEYYQNKPIAIKHLLTHTAGFDERVINIIGSDVDEELLDLGEYLKENMPITVREPGKIMQYSNHGLTLLGHIVENISGKKIDQYIEEEIFNKLHMEHSYYRYTKDIEELTSKCYIYSKQQYKDVKILEVLTHPAGSIVATSTDMAKFLMGHLESGKILNKETLDSMNKTQFTNHEPILGNCYGFYEVMRGNNRVVEHGGDTPGFTSLLSFAPEEKLGFFISANANQGGQELKEVFANKFYNYFLGVSSRDIVSNTQEGAIKINEYTGKYAELRIPRQSVFKILGPLMGRVQVKEIDENTVVVKHNGEEEIYYRIQGNLFKDKANNGLLTFERDSEGRKYIIKDQYPGFGIMSSMHGSYEKVNMGVTILENSIYIPIIVSIIYLITMIIMLFKKKEQKFVGNQLRVKKLMILTSSVILAEVAVFALIVAKLSIKNFSFDGELIIIYALSYILLGLTIATTIFTCKDWKQKHWPLKTRILNSIVVLSSILMVICIAYMNCFKIVY